MTNKDYDHKLSSASHKHCGRVQNMLLPWNPVPNARQTFLALAGLEGSVLAPIQPVPGRTPEASEPGGVRSATFAIVQPFVVHSATGS